MSAVEREEVLRVLLPAMAAGRVALCPRCCRNMYSVGQEALTDEQEEARRGGWWPKYPAMSRVDNETRICSECGTEEALEDALSGHVMGREAWGPRFLDQPGENNAEQEKHHE